MYMPLMWLIILGTAILSAVVTQALPSLPTYWNAFITRIRRVFTRKHKPDCALMEHNIEVIVNRVNELEEQVNNLATNHYRRDRNRLSNIRRDVRDYLKELADNKTEIK